MALPTNWQGTTHNLASLVGDCPVAAVVPSDSAYILTDNGNAPICCILYVNDPGGNIKVEFATGRTFVFKNYVGWIRGKIVKVWATGTTATDIGAFV